MRVSQGSDFAPIDNEKRSRLFEFSPQCDLECQMALHQMISFTEMIPFFIMGTMLKNIFTAALLPLCLFLFTFVATYSDLRFHLAGPQTLTPEDMHTFRNFSYDQFYEFDRKMAYKVEIQNDEGRVATALWPEEPYSKILVLVPYRSEELNSQTHFGGRLVRCLYKCLASDMVIEMGEFEKLIVQNFPDYAKKLSKMPQVVLNTGDTPKGFSYYLALNSIYFIVLGLGLVAGIGIFIKLQFFPKKKI
jgi:hypothetical protein